MNNSGQTGGWLRRRPVRELSPFGLSLWEDIFEPFNLLSAINDKDVKKTFSPKIDVRETETEIRVKAELPGLTQDQVHLNVTEDSLVLKGEKSEEKEEKDEKNIRRYVERTYGSFQRIIPLSAEVDHEKIDAAFKNGVLTVTLPKSKKAKDAVKTVTIRSE